MPLYEYACRDCGHAFEMRLSYDQRLNPQTCPACSGTRTMLRLSAPAAVAVRSASSNGDSGGYCQGEGGFCGCGRFDA